MRRQVTAQVKDNGLSHSSSDRNIAIASCSQSVKRPFQDCGVSGLDSDEKLPTSNPESESVSLSVTSEDLENTVVMTSNKTTKSVSPPCMAAKKKARHNYCSQRTLRSFFQKKPKHSDDCGSTDISLRQVDVSEKMADTHLTKEMNSPTETLVGDENSNCNTLEVGITLSTQCQGVENVSGSSDKEKNDVLLEWRRIQQLMQNSIPLCKGHGEPCVARAVKKPGPNLGRMFYVCARAEVLNSCYDSFSMLFMLSAATYHLFDYFVLFRLMTQQELCEDFFSSYCYFSVVLKVNPEGGHGD